MKNENPAIGFFLLERGANPSVRNNKGTTPLHFAGRFGQSRTAGLLIEKGAEINSRNEVGWSPLHEAAAYNLNPEIAILLIDKGADIEARNKRGQTALHLATERNLNPEIATFLLDRDAAPAVFDESGKCPADHAATNSAFHGTANFWRLHDTRF